MALPLELTSPTFNHTPQRPQKVRAERGSVIISTRELTPEPGWRKGRNVLLYLANIPLGLPNPSPGFGDVDYRIIRLDANGQAVWERYYGGLRCDVPKFFTQTEEGGFIAGGYSTSENTSGNKGVAGRGTWVLKLDSLGFKEAEFLLPGDYANTFPRATAYELVGAGTNSSYTSFSTVDLDALRRVKISASSSQPFNLDVSTNLVNWTPLVIDFTGELNLLQNYNGERKFYRAVEP